MIWFEVVLFRSVLISGDLVQIDDKEGGSTGAACR